MRTTQSDRSSPLTGLSLVVCCYNDGRLLASFLESVIRQEIPDHPFELIVVDNASTDTTSDVYKKFESRLRDRGITNRYLTESTRGLNHARNRGLAAASFSYVGFTDADARLSSAYVRLAVQLILERRPAVLCGPYRPWYDELTQRPPWFRDEYNSMDFGPEAAWLHRGQYPSGINMIFDRAVLLTYGGFGTRIVYEGRNDRGEETELFKRYDRKLPEPYIYYAPDILVLHYTRPESTSLRNRLGYMWGVGKSHASFSNRLSLIATLRHIFWLLRVTSADVLEGIFYRDRKRYPYLSNYAYERLVPRCYDLSLTLHRCRASRRAPAMIAIEGKSSVQLDIGLKEVQK